MMANTYTQLYYHIVFAVKGRMQLIESSWKDDLYNYITGIVSNQNQKMMIINGMPDHVHLLIGTKPNCNLSSIVRDIKSCSTKWINEKGVIRHRFSWQTGFGAFTVSHSQLSIVIDYIKNQEEHHRKKAFREEYISFLRANDIDCKDQYIFD